MVSHIPTFSIKTVMVRVKPDWVLPTLIGVGLFVAALSSAPWHTLLAIGVDLPGDPAGRLVERLPAAPPRRGRAGGRPGRRARRRASSASAASATTRTARAPRRTEFAPAEGRACSMRACVG